jgi:hypothetical protein
MSRLRSPRSPYAFVFTYLMLVVIARNTPVKVGKDEEEAGLAHYLTRLASPSM